MSKDNNRRLNAQQILNRIVFEFYPESWEQHINRCVLGSSDSTGDVDGIEHTTNTTTGNRPAWEQAAEELAVKAEKKKYRGLREMVEDKPE